jgi:hypothetical protein
MQGVNSQAQAEALFSDITVLDITIPVAKKIFAGLTLIYLRQT